MRVVDFDGIDAGFEGALDGFFEGDLYADDVGFCHFFGVRVAGAEGEGAGGVDVVRPAVQLKGVNITIQTNQGRNPMDGHTASVAVSPILNQGATVLALRPACPS